VTANDYNTSDEQQDGYESSYEGHDADGGGGRQDIIGEQRVLAVCTGGQLGLTSTKKSPAIALTFTLKEGPDAGRVIVSQRSLSGGAAEFTLEDMQRCGWDGEDLMEPAGIGGDKEVELVIVHETFVNRNGEDQVSAKVKNIFEPGGGARLLPMSNADKIAFKRSMAGVLATFQREKLGREPAQGQRAQAPQQPRQQSVQAQRGRNAPPPRNGASRAPARDVPPPPTDDDIPF